jgi:hypothetical protein
MKRVKGKTFALLMLPVFGIAIFSIWILPYFTRPVTLVNHEIVCGQWFDARGIWHSAEISYPLSFQRILTRKDQRSVRARLFLYDGQGHQIQGFSMGVSVDTPGHASAATFYDFKKLKTLSEPLHFGLEMVSEDQRLNRNFPELVVAAKDLPHQVGQKITANENA